MKTVTTDEFKALRDKNGSLAVINVLDEQYYQKEHIPDTKNVPLSRDDFVQAVEKETGGKDRPVIVYCASTDCDASPKAAKELESAGFTNVIDFEAGTKGWKDAGLPIEGAAAKT